MGKQAQTSAPAWEDELLSTRAHIESQLQSMQTKMQWSFKTRLDEKMEQMKKELEQCFQLNLQRSVAMSQIQYSTASNSPPSCHSKPFIPTHDLIEQPTRIQPTTLPSTPSMAYSPNSIAPPWQIPMPHMYPNFQPTFIHIDPINPNHNYSFTQPTIPTTHYQFEPTNHHLSHMISNSSHIPRSYNKNLRLDFPI